MLQHVPSTVEHIRTELSKIIVGQGEVIEQVLVALLAEGHALIEGVPGTAKTLLVKTLARIVGAEFSRIQFTPDLMPSDITGTNVFNTATSSFSLRRGPVFTDVLLADEINRTPPKTQAALLEAMEERQVTIDGEPQPLSPRAVPRLRHREPDRVRGHVPAARGAARPLPSEDTRQLPDGRGRGARRRQLGRGLQRATPRPDRHTPAPRPRVAHAVSR
jgi:MoxR-like ATPase